MKKSEKNLVISTMKGYAIFSVISAHTATGNYKNVIDVVMIKLLESVGVIGVIMFFVLAGYLFGNDKKSFIRFLLGKKNTIIIPWVFIGTLVYLLSSLLGTNQAILSFKNWIDFVVGNGSYLYFVPILIICYLLTFFARRSIFLIIAITISVASILYTSLGFLRFNPYLNVFNWLGYFSFGILLSINRDNILLKKINQFIFKFQKSVVILLLTLLISYFIMNISTKEIANYWNLQTILFTYLLILFIYILISNNEDSRILRFIGEISYPIYLLHMPVAGLINMLLKDINYTAIFKPFLVLILTISIVSFLKLLSKKLSYGNYIELFFGFRKSM